MCLHHASSTGGFCESVNLEFGKWSRIKSTTNKYYSLVLINCRVFCAYWDFVKLFELFVLLVYLVWAWSEFVKTQRLKIYIMRQLPMTIRFNKPLYRCSTNMPKCLTESSLVICWILYPKIKYPRKSEH